jgi:V/A-type H+-transporting ATPase subunit I
MARAPFTLLTIFSVATILWGALSNTWFGFHPAVFSNGVSEWLSAPGGKGDSNMMLICFTLGVIHLSIARVWNAMVLFPDTKFLAQVGWVGVIWFMYFLAGNIVGVLPMPFIMKIVLGISIFLIACFMLKRHELKSGAADLGMLPLNIISCLGDIISYVRLFAVGLAGVKVAENFNEMALSIDLPIYIKIVPIVLILLLGHALNFAMAGLSVLVHAVRLNTLEFSNHKGISWAGIPFTPFRKTAGIEE